MRLLDYARNVYSQAGDDGILEHIFSVIPDADKWCVDVGAWDGVYSSNTCNLIRNHGYSGILIEPIKSRFDEIDKNHPYFRVHAVNRFVGFTPGNNLDHILRGFPCVPKKFDFLDIDTCGLDYPIWAAMGYTPKVVHLVHNNTIGNRPYFVNRPDQRVNQGSSIRALVELGKQKGYELICMNANSSFFVLKEYFPLFEIADNRPDVLREHYDEVTEIFVGFDGTIFIDGADKLPCHRGIRISKRIRQLPRPFRKYPVAWFSPLHYKAYNGYWRVMQMLGRG